MNTVEKSAKIFALILAGFIIVTIFCSISFGFSFLAHIFDDKSYVKGNDFQQVYKNIKSINVNVSATELEIISGLEFSVEGVNISSNFQVEEENGILSILDEQSFFWNQNESKIVITVPEKELQHLNITTKAGKILIDSVAASSFVLSQGAGVTIVKDSVFDKTVIEGGAGKIDISDSTLNNLDLNAGAGKVEIEAFILGHSEIVCGVGKLEITLLGNKDDYQLHIEKGLGSILVENESYANDSVIGNGSNFISINGGIGAMEVKFEK